MEPNPWPQSKGAIFGKVNHENNPWPMTEKRRGLQLWATSYAPYLVIYCKWRQFFLKCEPFIFKSSGFFFDESTDLKSNLLDMLSKQPDLLKDSGNDAGTVKKAHKFGIDNLMPLMSAMNYNDLMSTYDHLFKDKSEEGVIKSNIFTELLGSTGTTAAAMVVR